ncbi:MAG: hypothetical protein K2X98_02400 [Alphaproteobacteria bacterium]|nr:hypothetical protein [Alphaproteobacteria bacterium]
MSKKINYEDLVQKSLVNVVRDLLRDASDKGLFANHHFYITYNTDHPGVEIPDYLREQYPDSITIVVQYEFWDLDVYDDRFEITLSFNNLHERLVVPFDAMTSFVDPSAKFGLQFTPSMPEARAKAELKSFTKNTPKKEKGARKNKFEIPPEAVEGNVISFDAFKKKN